VQGPHITAHPVQLTFAAACADLYYEENDAANGVVRRGIAYLIRADRAVTAAQAVRERSNGQTVWLRFSGGLRAATVLARDEEADCALLKLWPAVMSQLVLTLRRGLCQPGDACQTWEARPTLRSAGHVVQALVHEPLGEDELRGPALLLHLVAGSERWHPDLAGSPILHDGYVVGHLRAIIHQAGETMLRCCPAPYVEALELLPGAAQPPQPPKAGYAPAWYVARPEEEARALSALKPPARPLLVFASEGHGKTWFLHRLLERVRAAGSLGLCVNLERLPSQSRTSLDAFLGELGQRLYRQLANQLGSAVSGAEGRHVEDLLELALRSAGPRSLYLLLDQFDLLRDTMFHDSYTALLADWAERSIGNQGVWSGLRIVLMSATAPDWLMRPLAARPFVVQTQELADLSRAQLLELARLHQLQPEPAELDTLQKLIGGQPYLARVALYAAACRGEPLGEVLQGRGAAPAVFDAFLESCHRRVASQPGLWPTLERVLREQPLEALDRLLLPRLERMGIVRRVEPAGPHPEYRLRYPLYRRLLDL